MPSHFLLLLFLFTHATILFAEPGNPLPSLPTLLSSPPRTAASSSFTIFLRLLRISNLLPTLSKTPNITVLIPSDVALQQTAVDLNCPAGTSPNHTLTCLLSRFPPPKLARLLLYHVLPRALTFDQVRRRRRIKTLSNDRILCDGIMLNHLATAVPIPHFIIPVYNLRFGNGFLHAIDRMLFPFIHLNPEGNECLLLEGYYIVLANGKFVDDADIKGAMEKCRGALLAAVKECAAKNVCRTGYFAKRKVGGGLIFGEIVAAGSKCLKAARVIAKCRNVQK